LKTNPGAAIVYVTLQKQTEELAAELRSKGFKARSFHAGMDTATKTQLQEEFMKEEDLVIVATIAFGMGTHTNIFRLHLSCFDFPQLNHIEKNRCFANFVTYRH
jgi:superfamily II DNA helicase RecQ